MSKKTYLALIILGLLVGAFVAYAAKTWITFSTDGTIKTPANITATPTSIHWGQFDKDRNATWNICRRTFTLINNGQQPATLYFEYDTNPIIQSLTSDLVDGEILLGGASKTYYTELTIDPTTTLASFNFNIYITDGQP